MKIKRIAAYIIDFIIITIITGLITMLPFFKTVQDSRNEFTDYFTEAILSAGSSDLDDDEILDKQYESLKNSASLQFIEVGVIVLYFGVFGFLAKGQTAGKMLLKLKIVNNDETKEINPGLYIFREAIKTNVIFDFISDLLLIFASKSLYLSASSIISNIELVIILVLIGTMIFRDDERSLHDLICKTKVISTKNTEKVNS